MIGRVFGLASQTIEQLRNHLVMVRDQRWDAVRQACSEELELDRL